MSKHSTQNHPVWRNNDDSLEGEQPSSMKPISPQKFHKSSKRSDISWSAEKREIEQAVNEKKTEYDVRLKVFRQLTTYKKCPLQELAFRELDILMNAHLKGHLERNKLVVNAIQNIPIEGDTDPVSIGNDWEDASHEVSIQSLEEPKRPRSLHEEIDASSSPNKLDKDKYRKEFEAEVAILPYSNSSSYSNTPPTFLDPLWCMEPRIFAVEKSTTGKRFYIVAQLGRFMDHYWRVCNPTTRHYYEVIRENTPCRLYFGMCQWYTDALFLVSKKILIHCLHLSRS